MNCQDIKSIVGLQLSVDLTKRSRTRKLTEARFIYYDLCKRNAEDFTTIKCANIIGYNHASLVYGLGTHKDLMQVDPLYREKYEECRLALVRKKKRPLKTVVRQNRRLSNLAI